MPFYSPSTRGFYVEAIHGRTIPPDAIKITTRQHQELMLAQSQGHEIVPGTNGPQIHRTVDAPEIALARAVIAIKREARRRILVIASMERQSNDNAALALFGPGNPEFDGALERRNAINAVRAASNEIEGQLNGLAPDALASFDARQSPIWPDA